MPAGQETTFERRPCSTCGGGTLHKVRTQRGGVGQKLARVETCEEHREYTSGMIEFLQPDGTWRKPEDAD